ncbi:hypothetical protein ZWY2020_057840 [Hordeum vulgare]|nr:hypothetical protein ZWY2020_057840 [Hordeum vulgare]
MCGGNVSSSTVSPDGMSVVGDGGMAPVVAAPQASRSLLDRRFPQEVWRQGELELRREACHVLISHTPAMDALELRFGRYVLLATAVGDGEQTVTPVAMLATLRQRCGMVSSEVVIEVTCPPHDLWLTFSTEEKCTDVLFLSMKIKCCRRWIQFSRWNRMVRAQLGALEHKSKLTCEGLPNQAWTTASVKDVLKQLGGELIEIVPLTSRRELEIMAWLRDPFFVGKVVTVEIREPKLTNKPSESMDEYEAMQFELGDYGPLSPRKKNNLSYDVICHMKEVVDCGPLVAEGPPDEWLLGEGKDLNRKHIFKTVRGKIDGTDGAEAV